MSFRSVPSFGIDSSVNLGTPRNDHFLPRNNRNHSEYIPRNFFGTKIRCQPYFRYSYLTAMLVPNYSIYRVFEIYYGLGAMNNQRKSISGDTVIYEWRLSCTYDKSFAKFLIWDLRTKPFFLWLCPLITILPLASFTLNFSMDIGTW